MCSLCGWHFYAFSLLSHLVRINHFTSLLKYKVVFHSNWFVPQLHFRIYLKSLRNNWTYGKCKLARYWVTFCWRWLSLSDNGALIADQTYVLFCVFVVVQMTYSESMKKETKWSRIELSHDLMRECSSNNEKKGSEQNLKTASTVFCTVFCCFKVLLSRLTKLFDPGKPSSDMKIIFILFHSDIGIYLSKGFLIFTWPH